MTILVLDESNPAYCPWCQQGLVEGTTVVMEGRLTPQCGALYCAMACLEAHRAQLKAMEVGIEVGEACSG